MSVDAIAAAHGPAYLLAVLSTGGGLVSAVCAVFVVVRDGRRIKSGEARKLSERITRAQNAADRWHESERGRELRNDVTRNTQRIESAEKRLDGVATREDVARIEGSISRVDARLGDVSQGLDNIENLLIRKALGVESR